MPATTTIALASLSRSRCASSRCSPATPKSDTRSTAIAQRLGGQRGLLGHRQVRGAGRGHHDEADSIHRLGTHDEQARGGVVDTRHAGGLDGGRGRRVASRGEHVGVVHGQARDDRHHLLGGLARAEDGLRPAGAQRAVQIELGEAEILVGQRGQARAGGVDREMAAPHVLEKLPERLPIHQPGFFFKRRLALPD